MSSIIETGLHEEDAIHKPECQTSTDAGSFEIVTSEAITDDEDARTRKNIIALLQGMIVDEEMSAFEDANPSPRIIGSRRRMSEIEKTLDQRNKMEDFMKRLALEYAEGVTSKLRAEDIPLPEAEGDDDEVDDFVEFAEVVLKSTPHNPLSESSGSLRIHIEE